jgi:hypothetical protein
MQITVTGHYVDAPTFSPTIGVNLSPFFGPGSGFSQNNRGKAFLETVGGAP